MIHSLRSVASPPEQRARPRASTPSEPPTVTGAQRTSSDLWGGHEEVAGELVGVDLRGGPPPTIRAQIHEHRIGLIGVADEVPDLVGQRERTTREGLVLRPLSLYSLLD